jgi:hypothetical protein
MAVRHKQRKDGQRRFEGQLAQKPKSKKKGKPSAQTAPAEG